MSLFTKVNYTNKEEWDTNKDKAYQLIRDGVEKYVFTLAILPENEDWIQTIKDFLDSAMLILTKNTNSDWINDFAETTCITIQSIYSCLHKKDKVTCATYDHIVLADIMYDAVIKIIEYKIDNGLVNLSFN